MYELIESLVAQHRRDFTSSELELLLQRDMLHSLAPKYSGSAAPVFYVPDTQWKWDDQLFYPMISFVTEDEGLSYTWQLVGTIAEDSSHWSNISFLKKENRKQ